MATTKGVPVSERALIQRLNRKMHSDDLMVKTTRPGSRAEFDLGRHYILNWRIDGVMAQGKDIDLEAYGREYGVLKAWERLAD